MIMNSIENPMQQEDLVRNVLRYVKVARCALFSRVSHTWNKAYATLKFGEEESYAIPPALFSYGDIAIQNYLNKFPCANMESLLFTSSSHETARLASIFSLRETFHKPKKIEACWDQWEKYNLWEVITRNKDFVEELRCVPLESAMNDESTFPNLRVLQIMTPEQENSLSFVTKVDEAIMYLRARAPSLLHIEWNYCGPHIVDGPSLLDKHLIQNYGNLFFLVTEAHHLNYLQVPFARLEFFDDYEIEFNSQFESLFEMDHVEALEYLYVSIDWEICDYLDSWASLRRIFDLTNLKKLVLCCDDCNHYDWVLPHDVENFPENLLWLRVEIEELIKNSSVELISREEFANALEKRTKNTFQFSFTDD